MTREPLVTIAIPTFRRADLLRHALASALAQRGVDHLEVLVLENPDEDRPVDGLTAAGRLCAEVRDARLRYVCNERNLGMAGNWNRCLEAARGRWVLILHDDDWLNPHFLRLALAVLAAHPDLRLVGSGGVIERGRDAGDEDDTDPASSADSALPSRLKPYRIEPAHFLLGNPYFASGVLMDRRLALELGGFDAAWYPTMDHAFWQRFCLHAPCARIPEPLLHYYIGANASLHPSMLIRYIVNDFQQRRDLLAATRLDGPLLRFYSRLKPLRERLFLQKLFRLRVPVQELESALHAVGWRPVGLAWRWAYLPLRAGFELLSILLSRRLLRLPTREGD